MEGKRSAVTVWKKENLMEWIGQEECLPEEKWQDTDKDLNRGGWWLFRGEYYSEVALVRYYSDSFPMRDRAERKMCLDSEMEAERWVKDFGRIKFLKNPTAERPVETDGLSCGRDKRKCQNRMRESEALRWWKLKRRGVRLSVKRRRKYKKKSLADGSILSTQRCRKLKEIRDWLVWFWFWSNNQTRPCFVW